MCRYPGLWARSNRLAIQAAGLDDSVRFFSRSGSATSPGFSPLMWMGDQLVTFDGFDGLASALRGMMSYGFSGFSLAHTDVRTIRRVVLGNRSPSCHFLQIGGYTMIDQWPLKYLRSKQLLLRWMETAAFSDVVFRTHPGNLPSKSWQYNSDNETLVAFGTWARVHQALWPYRKALVQLAASTGVPVVRHPWLHYPGDATVVSLLDQFMVGDAVMVAPVVLENATTVQVYLPRGSGSWVHVWTGKQLPSPGWTTLAAPIGQPGVLVQRASPWAKQLIDAICSAAHSSCATDA